MARESTLRREEIVERATKLFAERGYTSTSLRDIMDGFDVSGPAFYHYFSSKEVILTEILDGALLGAESVLEGLLANSDLSAADRFMAAMRSHAEAVWNNSDAARVLFLDNELVNASTSGMIQTRMQRYTETLSDLYRQGVAEGSLKPHNPRTVTAMVLGMANWGPFWMAPGKTHSDELDIFIEVIAGGIWEPTVEPTATSPGITN